MIRITSLVSNDIVTDNRVHKIAFSLGENGYRVKLVGRKHNCSKKLQHRPYETRRLKLWFNKGPLFYLNLNLRFFFFLLKDRPDIILSNDLDTLPGCWMAARIRKKQLVFDSHELFPEVPELVNRPFIKGIWKAIERFFLPRLNYGFTVSKPIADYYYDNYGVKFELIRNLGRFRYDYEFKGMDKDPDVATIIYQGAVNLGRGLELAIQSMKHLGNARLWIVGDGDVIRRLRQQVMQMGLQDKISFMGRVPLEKLWDFTARADLGLSLEENLGLNYQYALPNKLFDYIQARIPVIVSDLPEMASLVKKYKIGKVLVDRKPGKLADMINSLLKEQSENNGLNSHVELAARELCWEREEEKLILLFKHVRGSVEQGIS
ncbi:MAG: glycosyltransferase [Bacteroidales bacterium]|nr:glycosyltransferase [Bacteroidales bacterium]